MFLSTILHGTWAIIIRQICRCVKLLEEPLICSTGLHAVHKIRLKTNTLNFTYNRNTITEILAGREKSWGDWQFNVHWCVCLNVIGKECRVSYNILGKRKSVTWERKILEYYLCCISWSTITLRPKFTSNNYQRLCSKQEKFDISLKDIWLRSLLTFNEERQNLWLDMYNFFLNYAWLIHFKLLKYL